MDDSEVDDQDIDDSEEISQDKKTSKTKNKKRQNKEEEDQSQEDEKDDNSDTSSTELYDSEQESESIEMRIKYDVIEDSTNRIAIVNCDWQKTSAVDLLIILRSFCPKNGFVKSVSIYPSEFGIKRMEEENEKGPNVLGDLKYLKDKSKFGDDINDDSEEEEIEENAQKTKQDDDEFLKDHQTRIKLRRYEHEKLKYFYAVCECDNNETASAIFKACDGQEINRTGTNFEMSFVSDDTVFPRQPKEVADKVPLNYKTPEWTNDLQLTSVNLRWDETDHKRLSITTKKLDPNEIPDETDYEAYLASSDSSSIEVSDHSDEDLTSLKSRKLEAKKKKIREKYASLLNDENASDEEHGNSQVEEQSEEMVVTFKAGLSESTQNIIDKKKSKHEKNETMWEKNARKLAEKKEKRKQEKKQNSDKIDDDLIISGGIATDQLKQMKKKEKKKKKKKTAEEIRKENEEKAELELLMLDENNIEKKGYNLKSMIDDGKKKKKNRQDDTFKLDIQDPRFKNLYNQEYGIDPNDPKYKKTDNMSHLMKHIRENRPNVEKDKQAKMNVNLDVVTNSVGSSQQELDLLINSVKRKSEKRLKKINKKGKFNK
eukprot:TRINITY_DN1107_c0_g1_i1.p1 TRINITY_DN1107_c0_g1~~TRINITY_DN1107_c0_g1_i1.p1  ORF type:complete len:683 (-),score=282.99 TRINITY_DN1107_c0_g1_i1:43-1839(-)